MKVITGIYRLGLQYLEKIDHVIASSSECNVIIAWNHATYSSQFKALILQEMSQDLRQCCFSLFEYPLLFPAVRIGCGLIHVVQVEDRQPSFFTIYQRWLVPVFILLTSCSPVASKVSLAASCDKGRKVLSSSVGVSPTRNVEMILLSHQNHKWSGQQEAGKVPKTSRNNIKHQENSWANNATN